MRRFGDFAAAEDAVQESLIAAATQWPLDGMPQNPRGWLIQVASRRMTDTIRSESARRRRESQGAGPDMLDTRLARTGLSDVDDRDDTLVLLFMCCHPALSASSAIALTLRALGGLTTAEIAHAFLVPESTMAQRISRARQSVRSSGVAFEVPTSGERAARLGSVLHVLYLMFNEGYATSSGPDLRRPDLSAEAIRLTREVHRWLPDETEVAGLLALMLLTDARRAARTTADGELVPLDQQDRSLWNGGAIEEGIALISATLPRGAVGPYQLQAAIAAVHDEAATAADTDWPQILGLYEVLQRVAPSPVVDLNRAVALAQVAGPAAGLAAVEALGADPAMAEYRFFHATRADFLRRLARWGEAAAAYGAALALTSNE